MQSLRPHILPALRVALIYAIVGGLWILFSDAALEALVPDPTTQAKLQTWKGWFYVFITAILLFGLVLRQLRASTQAARRLHANRDAFHGVFRSMPLAVHGYDEKGKAVFWNQGSEDAYGYKAEEALGRHLSELVIPKKGQLDTAETIRSLTFRESTMRCAPLTMIRKDGTLTTVHSTHLNLPLPGGRMEIFFMDIPLPEGTGPASKE